MAHDVGHGLTQRQRKHGFLRRAERKLGDFAVHGDARGLQRLARANQFGGESLAAISADGFAHVGQRGARGVLHVLHLLLGALRIAVHQLARQLGLQSDERQRVSQQIVQVAGDAFALGDLGQVLDLVVGHCVASPPHSGDRTDMVADSHQDDQQQHRAPKLDRQVQAVGVEAEDGERRVAIRTNTRADWW